MAHKAIIAKIDSIVPIEGADRIQVGYVLGEPVVISKEYKVGDMGVFFPVDVQLSEEYCSRNNLFRDSSKNSDNTKKGFFEDNRRVRAQPFLKVRSCGLFMPVDSLSYTGNCVWELGQTFDVINGISICQKYISEQAKKKMANGSTKPTKQSLYPTFEKHQDTEQFLHFIERIPTGSLIHITAKAHGTSWRVGKKRQQLLLPRWKQLVNKFVPVFSTQSEYQMVVGTRNVILENEDKEGFHGSEKFRYDMAKEIYPYMEDGMTCYGELIGFANQLPLMPSHNVEALKDKSYTEKYGSVVTWDYGCKEHEYKWFVYRITREGINGENIDMSQMEMEQWCKERNIPYTLKVCDPFVYDGDSEALKNKVISLSERGDLLAECYLNPKTYGEGVVVRVESGKKNPDFYKYKNFAFRVGEGIIEVEDMETLS